MINLLLLLAVGASAQTQSVPNVKGPALEQLASAAENSAKAGAVMDGSKKQAVSGDGTVVESTRRETYVRDVPPSHECDYAQFDGDHDGRMHPYRPCVNRPARRERVDEDVETVRIVDRGAYVKHGRNRGTLIGGGIGLLGFLALFAGPIGWAVGAATVLAGAAIGAYVGKAAAKGAPSRFERVRERGATPIPF